MLTGGAVWDSITGLPDRISRLWFKSTTNTNHSYRYNGGGTQIPVIAASEMYDTEWCDWRMPDVQINGAAADVIVGEYWE